mmetsp:Transcript_14663/g.16924  ORF Transcript_14663/g.16924 Transcript_14663/m.16924 type:complete len:131 (+) Transcript_14663:84-476(+)
MLKPAQKNERTGGFHEQTEPTVQSCEHAQDQAGEFLPAAGVREKGTPEERLQHLLRYFKISAIKSEGCRNDDKVCYKALSVNNNSIDLNTLEKSKLWQGNHVTIYSPQNAGEVSKSPVKSSKLHTHKNFY